MASLRSMKGQRMSFIIVWKVAGELHSPKNMMRGSNSPWFMEKAAFLLLDEEHRSPNQRFRWMDSSVGQILSEECIKLLLFCGGEGECPPSGEFGIRMKLYGMVPCLVRGEMGKGFFGEDVCEVFVALWNGALGQMDSLGLSLFCKSLPGGQCGAHALLPF